MRVHRLIAILLLIESRGKMKASALAEALETSVRSIYRDIDVLAESGIPLCTTTGPGGGISLMEGYTVNLRRLHGEEVVQLFLTGMGMPAEMTGESSLLLTNALLKLEATLPAPYLQDIRTARNRFLFDTAPWWDEQAILPCLETLRAAVWRGTKLKVLYRKVNGDMSHRSLHPYGLVVKQGAWYLVAYCESALEVRTFKCERFASVEGSGENCTIPDDFSLQQYWSESNKTFMDNSKTREFYPVVLRTQGYNQELLNQLEVLATEHARTELIITANMYDYETACAKVLPLLVQAEILEPLPLRDYIAMQIRTWQNIYLCD
ncbi:WYL domain-containing protein [Paenibacillus sp. MMS20-IR301]|uniref:helix-turn-helix transcriptional regulator n=1 Tax=Paenibacillus sp. MMS20-IR301 TaxID=2895946 RepID=UPI0028EA5EF1|nr:WYL domain-containing protein [Paenibacillus sp. MMS20-IR301]WNS45043.1 WYL domain-containing protein [Paenibacillus sp. MMS20-IR301]